ncbi:MAG: hypothetical protein KME18_21545 [Phormidium tanganyikae FI6-MK23]|jgi:hypothetical protein|nr:hypothetical protein [Phormidium tanganyikae FI6-MK23]
MAACTDPAIDHLNQLGYNALKLPRQSIAPLMVLSRDPATSICSLFGHISDIVEDSSVPLPKVWENLDVGTISGMRTNRLEFKFGLSILNTLLSAIGAKSAGLDAAFGNASTLEFEYENVLLDNVMPASVSAYLRRATPFIDEPLVPLFDAQGEAYIVIDVLKSNSFGIRAYRDAGGGIDLNLDAVKEIVGISSKFVIEKKSELKISFQGEKPLGFGFKACPIWIENVDEKSRFRLDPSTNQAIDFRGSTEATADATEAETELTPVLIAPNELMEFI